MGWLLTSTATGLLAFFAMYWDDSLHTDVGRDSFWSAPHVLLYGSLTLTVVAVGVWGRTRAGSAGVRAAWADPLLRWAAVSAAAIAVAAPADAAWHTVFGRDSVLWSPPHVLALTATFALAAAILRGVTAYGGGWPVALAGALVLGAALSPVMEYESDVPQFSTVWFLPAASSGITLAIILVRRLDRHPWAASRAALLLTGVRVLTVAVLAGIGHSTPIVPPVLAIALLADLLHRRLPSPWWLPLVIPAAVHLTYVPWLHVVPHGAIVTSGQYVPSVTLAVAGSALAVFAAEGMPRAWYRGLQGAGMASAVLIVVPLLTATTAFAHDPGQGIAAGEARWDAVVLKDSTGITLTTTDATLAPVKLVARRAGEEAEGSFTSGQDGVYRGSIALHSEGRWFLYAEFQDTRSRAAETWISVQQGRRQDIKALRPVYLPRAQIHGADRTAATVTLYGLSAAILTGAARSGRRRKRRGFAAGRPSRIAHAG